MYNTYAYLENPYDKNQDNKSRVRLGDSDMLLQLKQPSDGLMFLFSAEESEEQIALRAKRLEVLASNIHLCSENRIDEILNHVTLLKPKLLIIDSIQTIFSENIDSLPGSVSQIRECGQKLLQLAKDEKITILVIGHVTKEGIIAGPKMLEHMVDTVLYLEGDERHDHRILRSVKNRFGTTNEVGIFQMTTNGLDEVKNPSELFLAERRIDITGSTIFPSLEGTRPILVEIQSLVSVANFNAPQRNVNGFDFKRLSMLLAVLEKRMGYKMGMKDVFVNLVGGLKINDPAADLSVISALASSEKDQLINDSVILIGEVGLGGEIRSVTKLEDRLKESIALGFTEVVAPKASIDRLKEKPKGIKLHPVSHVVEAFRIIFK